MLLGATPPPQPASARASNNPAARGRKSFHRIVGVDPRTPVFAEDKLRRNDCGWARRVQAMPAKSMASIIRAWGPGKRGRGRIRGGMADGAVVVTMIVKLPPGATESGAATQVDAVGNPPQVRATNSLNPPSLPTLNLYIADCPGEMVAEDEEPAGMEIVKSCQVPLRLTVWVVPEALRLLSVIVKEPVKVVELAPEGMIDGGVKETLMVQEPPAARLPPQVLVWPKSPRTLMLARASAAVPVLLRVTGRGTLAVPSN